MFRRLELKAALLTAALCLLLTQGAGAHAVLKKATPAPGSQIHGSNFVAELKFNARIDGKRSTITLALPDKTKRPLEMLPQPSADVLKAQAKDVKPGAYRILWQVLAEDGHITRGQIPFRVE